LASGCRQGACSAPIWLPDSTLVRCTHPTADRRWSLGALCAHHHRLCRQRRQVRLWPRNRLSQLSYRYFTHSLRLVQIKAQSLQYLDNLEALRWEREFFGDVLLGAARNLDCAVGEAATGGWRRSAATPRRPWPWAIHHRGRGGHGGDCDWVFGSVRSE
jgi:hypothetical protein